MPSYYLNGGLTIAGTHVQASVIESIYRRMLEGEFTNEDLVEVARGSLRQAGQPISMAVTLADRVRRGQRSRLKGKCEVVSRGWKGVSTYRFTPYDRP